MNYNEELLSVDFIEDARETLPRNEKFKWSWRDPAKLKGLIIHQSLEERGSVNGNAKYHSGPNHISKDGLPGLSYTFFVEKDGLCHLANSVEAKTISQGYGGRPGDENEEFMSACFGGNFSSFGYQGTQDPTSAQLQMVEKLWRHCKEIWYHVNMGLYGHCDFGKPACPGDMLMERVNDIRPAYFSSVSEKQKALQKLGYYKSGVDGQWGPASKIALVEFQKIAGLIPDGVWGVKTTEAMRVAILG